MSRATLIRCDGCGVTMTGGPVIGVGAGTVRSMAAEGVDPGWHYDGSVADGIGRDLCPTCWAAGIR